MKTESKIEVPIAEIICLCGSTKFFKLYQHYNLKFTCEGKIVLSIGAALGSDDEHFGHMDEKEKRKLKAKLDVLHIQKIDLADTVFIIDDEIDGKPYIGESTEREVAYAEARGKAIRYHSIESKIERFRAESRALAAAAKAEASK